MKKIYYSLPSTEYYEDIWGKSGIDDKKLFIE